MMNESRFLGYGISTLTTAMLAKGKFATEPLEARTPRVSK